MKYLLKYWSLLLKASFIAIGLIFLYCVFFYNIGIIPLGGKKAPSFALVLLVQFFLVKSILKLESIHFLKIFVFQYLFIFLVSAISSLVFYYFYLSELGISVLNEYIQLSVSELQQYKSVIIEQEGIEYYKLLLNGINGIDAGSIAKDDFTQKIALAFLPNLLISLYFKQD